jgi:L-alanine-DL-glutamate epimerase-like enolase superfamily enzyme
VAWEHNTSAWVRIWTDSGLYGLGEASPLAQGNASLEIIASACAPLLMGADLAAMVEGARIASRELW